MMNCFCRMVYRQKVCSLISSRDHCQRSSPSQILDTSRAEFEPVWKCRWSCAVVVTIKPWPQRGSLLKGRRLLYLLFDVLFKVPVKVCWGSMISFFPRLWPKNPIFFLSLLTLLINSPPSALLQQQMMVFWKVH